MTPEDLIRRIAEAVAIKITSQPPKTFEVHRTAPDGSKRAEAVTLPQVIAELSDHLRISNELSKLQIQATHELFKVSEANRRIGAKMIKLSKKKPKSKVDDDDDDEEDDDDEGTG